MTEARAKMVRRCWKLRRDALTYSGSPDTRGRARAWMLYFQARMSLKKVRR